MTHTEALMVLMWEARSEKKWTNASVGRVVKALKALDIRGEDQWEVLRWLEILDGENKPHRKELKPVWDRL